MPGRIGQAKGTCRWLLALALALLILCPRQSKANVSVTPATGGTNISADVASDAASPNWITLGSFVINEGQKMDISTGSGQTLVLKAPGGFQFNTSVTPNISFTAGDITAATIAVTDPSTLTITLNVGGSSVVDHITVGSTTGIQVRPITGTNLASGIIYRPTAGGGTVTMSGLLTSSNTNGSGGESFAALSEVVGTATQLTFTTQPGNATTGAIFGTQPVVKSQDQFGNNSATGLPANLNVTVTLSSGTGPLLGTTALNIGTAGGNGTVTYTNLEIDVPGSNDRLTAAASGLSSDVSATFSVNGRPVISSIADQVTPEDQPAGPIAFTIGDFETAANSLVLSAFSSNTNLIPVTNIVFSGSNSNRNVTVTPIATLFGTATITLVVSDGTASASNSFLVTVTSVNDPPTMNAITNRTILEEAGLQTVNLSGISPGPANESSQTNLIAATSSNPAIIPNPTVNYTNPSTTGTLTFTPVANQFGTVTITVIIKDNGGTTNGGIDSLTNTFTVTVQNVNDPPTLGSLTNWTILEDAGNQTVALSNITPGPTNENAQVLTVTATSSNPSVVPNPTVNYTSPATTGSLVFAPAANQFGSAVITVIVKDDGGTANGGVDSVTNTFTVTVLSVNDPPTLTTLTNMSIPEDAGLQTVNLTGIAPGPSNESTQTVTVTASSSNPSLIPNPTVNYANPNPTGTITFTPVATLSGSAVITVILKDNGGTTNGGVDSLTNTFTVTVLPVNDPPTLNALTNLTLLEDGASIQTVNLGGISPGATNESSQVVTITASSSNPSLIPNPVVNYTNPSPTGTLTLAPIPNQFGSATITVIAKDDGGTANGGVDSVTNTFTVTVQPVNDPPTLNALTNWTVLEDASAQTVNLSGITVGPTNENGQTLTVTASSSNPGLIPNPTVNYSSPNPTGTLVFTPVATQFGSAVITVVVKDNGGVANGGIDSVTNTFTVTVLPVNDPPTITTLTNLTILEDATTQTVNMTGISPGPANEAGQTITITASSSNPGLIPDPTVNYTSPNATGTLTFAPLTNQFGSANITVILSDDGGTTNGGVNSLTNTFTVTVTPVNDAPTLNPINNLVVNVNPGQQTVNLSGISAGPANENGQVLTITATSSNLSLIPNPTVNYTSPNSSGSISFTPVNNASGTGTVAVTVKDNGGTGNGGQDTLIRLFTVTVSPLADLSIVQAAQNPGYLGGAITHTLIVSNGGPTTASGIQVTNPLPAGVGFVSVTSSQGTATNQGGIVSCSLGTLANGATATITLVLQPNSLGSYTNTASVSGGGVPDPNLANNNATSTVNILTPTFSITGATLSVESCTNGAVDPAEQTTLNFSIKNNGGSNTTNLVATLKALGGVTSPSAPQNYGALVAGGASVARSFTFVPIGVCGGSVTATLQLQDGQVSLGAISISIPLGAPAPRVTTFTNATPLAIPSIGIANLYPSPITVSGISGPVQKITVTFNNLTHTQPDDLDILLVSPQGQNVMLMSDAGGINTINNVTLTVDDTAPTAFPDTTQIVAGSYKPTDYQTDDVMPFPAPGRPYGTNLSSLYGQDPNGQWQLYVNDDTANFSGTMNGGWKLAITSIEPTCCVDRNSIDLTLGISSAPDPDVVGNIATNTISVTNLGPASATSVTVTNPLPAGAAFVSATASQGSCTLVGNAYVCSLGTLASNASATIQIAILPGVTGPLTNLAQATAAQPDYNPSNNVATYVSTVSVPAVSIINNTSVPEGNSGTTNVFFTVQLSATSSQTIQVNYATADDTATAGSDYVATNGVLVFNPGETTKTIVVAVKGDTINEATEFFDVVLNNPVNVTIDVDSGSCAIIDDDPLPSLSINDISIVEGNSGTTNANFTVTLSPASGQTVNINYSTANGTALGGSDFVVTNGTVVFNPGDVAKTISIPVIGDTVNETNETFFVNLSGQVNANISKAQGTGTIINDDFLATIGTTGTTLASESCAPTNGVIDPNETVTVNISLRNISAGTASTTNLTATLLQLGGITAPGASQNYGALTSGGAAVSRPFTFTANGACGDTLVVVLQLQDGGSNLGMVTNLIPTGKSLSTTNSFANSGFIDIQDASSALPYPSTITISNLSGVITKVTATFNGLSHTYPADIDALLVGPGGQTVMLMSDAGSGNSLSSVTLTFDDAAAAPMTASGQIVSGTYKPTDYEPGDLFPIPAPAGPYGTSLGVFNGTSPNGNWSLYVVDDTGGDAGNISGGWSLTIRAFAPPICCGGDSMADISAGMTGSAASVPLGSNITYTISVTNLGPNTSSDVVLTDPLPAGSSFVSASTSLGNITNVSGVVTCNLGTMTNNAKANISITVNTIAPNILTNVATLSARTPDPNSGNNSPKVITTVIPPAPTASFTAAPLIGTRPLTVTFSDNSTGVTTNRFWNFGDSTTTNTTATNFTHTYYTASTNTVALTAIGPGGSNTMTRANYIAVTNGPLQLIFIPISLNFGQIVIGQAAVQTFQVINSDTNPISGTMSTAPPFSLDNSGFLLSGGQTGFVNVTFSPVSVGAFSNAVTFVTSGGNSTNVVIGTGITPAQLGVTPSGISFGTVAVGSNVQASFTITNLGQATLSNGVATITGGPFSVTSNASFTVPGLSATNVVVNFAPVAAGNFSNAVVFTSSNGGNSTNSLTGTGAIVPIASFSGTPTNGLKPLTVTFTDNSTGTITNRFWDFGDGSTTNTSLTTFGHTYANASTNTVTLTVTGPVGTNTSTLANYIVATNLPPQLTLTPAGLSFGSIVIGQTNTLNFQIVNTGGLNLSGSATSSLPFRVQSGSPFNIAPGQTGLVAVSFAPTNALNFSNVVVFTSNGGNSTNTVTGTGLTPAQLSVSPAALSFGTIATGSSAQQSFVVTNLGGAVLSNGTATVTGGPFTILSGTPFSLPGFGSTNLVVQFSPGSAANFSNAVIFATGNDGGSTNAVTGVGAIVPVANFTGSPTNGAWLLTVVFTDSSTGTITNRFWNFGDGVTTNTSATTLSHVYTNAATNTVVLTVTGPVGTNTLSIANYIAVTNPPPLLSVTPASFNFGSVTIGQTPSRTFTVANLGGLPLTGSITTAPPFSLSSSGLVLQPGQTSTVDVTFSPVSAGAFSNVVVFTSNGGNSTNPVTGTGLTPAQLTVSPASINFGIVAVGTNSTASFAVTNQGGTTLSNGTATVTSPFSIVSPAAFSLPGFGTTNVIVRFTPTNASSSSNAVLVSSSNGGSSTNTVLGTGAIVPVAAFTGAPTNGVRPLTVSFTDNSTGTITNRFWDFGDGSTTNTSATSFDHVYLNGSTNTVLLTVTGPVGTNTLSRANYIRATNPPPLLTILAPTNLTFGQVIIGQTNSQNFQIVNNGGLTLTGNVSTTLPFLIQSGTPFSLPPGQTGLVAVGFAPSNAVNFSNAVVFISNGGNSTNSVTGSGLTPPHLAILPSTLNFGTVAVSSNAQASFTVTNTGGAALSNGVVTVTAGPFTILSGTPFNLAGFGATNLVIGFTPASVGNFTNLVTFTTANAGNSTNTVTGIGAAVPVAGFSGSPTIGIRPLTVTFTDSSTGTITNRFWDFGDGSTTNTTATTFSHLYATGSTNTVSLTVTGPVGTNTFTRTNYITATNPPPLLAVTPASIDFGPVVIGQTNTRSFQVVNNGGLPLTGSVATTPPFAIQSGTPLNLAIGQTGLVTVSFAPTNAVTFSNAVVFTSNGGNSTNTVTGSGLTPGQLGVLPASLDFGYVLVGSNTQASFVVTNSGGATLSNGVATVGSGPFSIISGSPFILPGFGTTNLVVQFAPTNAASFSNVVSVSAGSGANSLNTVTGTGALVPSASFTAAPTNGAWPLPVSFTDSSAGTITNRTWDFGDGVILTTNATQFSHTYLSAGSNTVTLTVSGPVGSANVTLTNYIVVSNPPPLLSISPTNLDFSSVMVGQSSTGVFQVVNAGGLLLTGSVFTADPFSISGDTNYSILPGQTGLVSVVFAPTNSASYSNAVAFVSNGGSSTNSVFGLGLVVNQLAVFPSPVDFGIQAVGSTAQVTLVVTNLGPAPVTNGSAVATGGPFTVVSGAQFTLDGFAASNIVVQFSPPATGNFSNAVVFATEFGPAFVGPLQGVGALVPQADFAASPTTGLRPLTVNFTDNSSGTITNRFWDFGDGTQTNTTLVALSHTYLAAGSNTVTLTVTGPLGTNILALNNYIVATNVPPQLLIVPSSIDFGPLIIGQTSTQLFSVINTGGQDLAGSAATALPFDIPNPGYNVAPGQTGMVAVTFTPTNALNFSNVVVFSSNGGNSTNTVTGVGLTPAQLSVSPASLDFGTIAVGSASQIAFVITNRGDAPLTNGTASIGAGPFSILSGTPYDLPGHGSTNLVINFAPTNETAFSNAVVFTSGNDGNSTNPVIGSGAFAPIAGFSGSPTFGVPPLTVVFSDASTGNITNRFWDFGDGSTTNTTATTLSHTYINASTNTVILEVRGIVGTNSLTRPGYIVVTNQPPQLAVTPANINFGAVIIGQTNIQSFVLTNSGGLPLIGTASSAAPFGIVSNASFNIAPGQTGLVQVSFTPTDSIAFSNVVLFLSNGGNSTNTVTGSGLTPAQVAVTPSTVNFGTVAVGSNAQASFTITNLGGVALSNGVAILNGGPFSILSGTPFNLPGFGSTNLVVRFTPVSAVNSSNLVTISTGNGGNTTNSVVGIGAVVPAAAFSGTPTYGLKPLTVTFTDTSTGTITNRFWDFGDGTTTNTTATSFTHLYANASTNNVSLTVTGPVGTNTFTRSSYVVVTNPPPQLALSPVSLAFGFVIIGQTNTQNFQVANLGGLQLTGSVTAAFPFIIQNGTPFSIAPGQTGQVAVSFAPTNAVNSSNVVVFTSNGGNSTNAVFGTGALVPLADFAAAPTNGVKPLVVTFSDNSSGTITNRFWDFGDGSTTNTSATSFTHTYLNASTNTVTLKVTGPVGTNTLSRVAFITVTNPPPVLSVNPASIAFGTVIIGQTNVQSFQLVNPGGQTLTGTVATTLPFRVQNGSPFSVLPGQTGTVSVSFAPVSAGAFSNVVVFSSNGGNSSNTVTGTGITPAQLAVTPSTINFGTIAVGTNAQLSFTVTNSGGASLTNGIATVNGGPFTILSGTPFNLPGFSSTNLVIRFAPGTATTFSNVVVVTTGNDGASTNVVRGTGAIVPVANFTGTPASGLKPLSVSFTDTSTGTITNRFWNFGDGTTTNTSATTFTHIYANGSTNTVILTVTGPVGTNTLTRSNYIAATNPPPQLAVSPSTLSFGSIVIGQTNTLNFQVGNTGGLTLNGTVATTLPFLIQSGTPFSVAPGQTSVVSVSFAPTNAINFSNVVVFTSNGGNRTNTVTGSGLTPAKLSVSPPLIDFGTVANGSIVQSSFTITNLGSAPLSNGIASLNPGPFSILSGTPFNLPGFGRTNLVVRFVPNSAVNFSNVIVFTSDNGGGATNAVIGTGADIPFASFAANPTSGLRPLTVTFIDNSTGTITNRFWNFGDGTTTNTTALVFSHTYTNASTNSVTLVATGPVGTNTLLQTGYITVTNPPPLLILAQTNLNFGQVVIGQSASLFFQVTNGGGENLVGQAATALPFAIQNGGFELLPGNTGLLQVVFNPTSAGSFSNVVVFTSNGGNRTNTVTGTGITPALLQVSPPTMDFGIVAPGATAQTAFTATNLGGGWLSNATVTVSGGPFTVVSPAHFDLPGFGSTNIVIQFAPVSGGTFSNIVVVLGGGAGNSTNTVTGLGAVAPTANFAVNPASGLAPLTVNFTDLSSGTIASRFWDFGDGSTTNTAATSFTHTYTAAGTNTVTLTVSGPAGFDTTSRPGSVVVTNIPPILLVTPAGADFGSLIIGQSSPNNFQVVNMGGLPLSGTVATLPPFGIQGAISYNLAPGETGVVSVTFTPLAAGSFSNVVVFTSNGGNSTNTVTGSGLTPPQLVVIQPSLNFGVVAVAGNAQASFTVTNTGGGAISNGTATVRRGTFSVVSGTPFNLPGFGSTNVVIRFSPISEDVFSNVVTFATDNGGSSTNPVIGIGATAPVANFNAGPTTGAKPLTVTFVDSSTGLITNRFWDFGDSTTTNTSSGTVTHTYTTLGTNTVTLQVTGPLGSSLQVRTNYIAVLDQLIITSIRLSGPDTLISFSSQSGKFYRVEYTDVLQGAVWQTAADFVPGTGGIAQATDFGGASHSSRFYRVKLLNNNDLTPSANFTGTPTSGTAPMKVDFSDTSTGQITNRFWDFGDGTTTNTTLSAVSHTYNTPGTHSVTLQVSGPLGTNAFTRSNYIVTTSVSKNSLRITSIQLSGSNVVISFTSQAGQFYRVEYADGPQGPTWQTAVDLVPGNGGNVQTTHVAGAGKASRFYQVKQLP